VTVDLGCGPRKRGTVGIDRVPGPGVDYVCLLGFDAIPLPDGCAELVTAYDLLEHIPAVAPWRDAEGRWHVDYPRIQLVGEVFRILRPGGSFISSTPTLAPAWAQDPTHTAPPWVAETWDYFCGRMGAIPAQYGITWAFALVERRIEGAHLWVHVRKPDA
jgi:SAM-dependent methyltransferase